MSEKSKGKRYTEKEKAQVLAFVDKTNATKGRGGITAASKKFGVTPLTISNWLKKVGGGGTGRRRMSADFSGNLRRLADLHEAIGKKEAELNQLQRDYTALKTKL
jgi:transposase-like protein